MALQNLTSRVALSSVSPVAKLRSATQARSVGESLASHIFPVPICYAFCDKSSEGIVSKV